MSVALCLSYNDISDFWCVVDQEGRMPPWPVGIVGITTCFFGFRHLCSLSCKYSPCPGELRALGAVAQLGFRLSEAPPAAKVDVGSGSWVAILKRILSKPHQGVAERPSLCFVSVH